jgi:hypothetical protein
MSALDLQTAKAEIAVARLWLVTLPDVFIGP